MGDVTIQLLSVNAGIFFCSLLIGNIDQGAKKLCVLCAKMKGIQLKTSPTKVQPK